MRSLICLLLMAISLRAAPTVEKLVADDPVVRLQALRELAALPAERRAEFVPALIRELDKPAQDHAYRAAHALAKVGQPALAKLRALLDDPQRRAFAIEAVTLIKPEPPDFRSRLEALLSDPAPAVSVTAAEALLSLGYSNPTARTTLEQWLRSYGPPRTPGTCPDVRLCIQQLLTNDRFTASDRLANTGDHAIPELLAALRDPDFDIRSGAAKALSDMNSFRTDVEEALITALKDPSEQVRQSARNGLSWMTLKSRDARLENEVAEVQLKNAAAQRERDEQVRPHTREEITADIPPDADHRQPMALMGELEIQADDGATLVGYTHGNQEQAMLLRLWRADHERYILVKKYTVGPYISLTTDSIRYAGQTYVHVNTTGPHAYVVEDLLFRWSSAGLTEIHWTTQVPDKLGPNELIRKSPTMTVRDDYLGFSYSVYKPTDPACCPTAGGIEGTYKMVGNELRLATWRRVPAQ